MAHVCCALGVFFALAAGISLVHDRAVDAVLQAVRDLKVAGLLRQASRKSDYVDRTVYELDTWLHGADVVEGKDKRRRVDV